MVARKQSAFGGYNMSTGVKAHVAVLAAAKQVGLRGGYPGR